VPPHIPDVRLEVESDLQRRFIIAFVRDCERLCGVVIRGATQTASCAWSCERVSCEICVFAVCVCQRHRQQHRLNSREEVKSESHFANTDFDLFHGSSDTRFAFGTSHAHTSHMTWTPPAFTHRHSNHSTTTTPFNEPKHADSVIATPPRIRAREHTVICIQGAAA